MTIKKAYTTKQKLDSLLRVTPDESETTNYLTEVEFSINSAIDVVDNLTQRNFVATEATAKLYSGYGGNELRIDECIEVTKVERGLDTYGDSKEEISAGGYNGYYLLPANYEDRKTPITHIHLRDRYWVRGFQNNQITAKWGFSEVCPDDVSWATTVIAGGIYEYRVFGSKGTGEVKAEKIGNYNVSYDVGEISDLSWGDYNRAKMILDKYKRIIL